MSNNLQALKALKQSAEKQNEELESSLKEIHKQSLKQLSEDLRSTMSKKLNKIENDMLEMQEKNKKRYSLKHLVIAISATALISLLIGLILADYTPKYQNLKKWQVPTSMRYTDTDGTRYIYSKKTMIGNDQKTTFIKIGD